MNMWKYENADIYEITICGNTSMRKYTIQRYTERLATVYEIYFVQEKYEPTTGPYI
jgi:hypothetical protein